MAKIVIADTNDNIQNINIADPNAPALLPEETFNQLTEQEGPLREMIDIDGGTINDPGYVDLSGLSALKNVQPDTPGKFPNTSVAVTFTDAEKSNLQTLIAKLASVAHNHTISSSDSSGTIAYSCDNVRCSWCENHSNNGNNSNHGNDTLVW